MMRQLLLLLLLSLTSNVCSSSTFKKKRLEDEAYVVVEVVLVFAAAIQWMHLVIGSCKIVIVEDLHGRVDIILFSFFFFPKDFLIVVHKNTVGRLQCPRNRIIVVQCIIQACVRLLEVVIDRLIEFGWVMYWKQIHRSTYFLVRFPKPKSVNRFINMQLEGLHHYHLNDKNQHFWKKPREKKGHKNIDFP